MTLTDFFYGRPVASGIAGIVTSAASTAISITSIMQGAAVVLGLVSALFGAGTAVYTFFIVRRRWRERAAGE